MLTATPTNGAAPLTVAFSSEGSKDPDPADSITFAWDFDGNGTTDSTDPDPTHTYTTNGVYTARLTVTDSSGKTASANTHHHRRQHRADRQRHHPARGRLLQLGRHDPVHVTVTDPEDGPIDCARSR